MTHLRALDELSATATNTILGIVIGVLLAIAILVIFFLVAHQCRCRRSKPVLHASATERSTVDAYPVYHKAPRAYSYRYSRNSGAMPDSQRVFVQTQAGGFNATRAALGCTQAFGLGADANMDPSDRGGDMHRASSLTFQDLAASTRLMLGFTDEGDHADLGRSRYGNRSEQDGHSSRRGDHLTKSMQSAALAASTTSSGSSASSTAMLGRSNWTDHEPMRRLTEEPDDLDVLKASRVVLAKPIDGDVAVALPSNEAALVTSTQGLPSTGTRGSARQHALASSSHSVPILEASQLSNTDSLHVDTEDENYLSVRTPPAPAPEQPASKPKKPESRRAVAIPALSLYL